MDKGSRATWWLIPIPISPNNSPIPVDEIRPWPYEHIMGSKVILKVASGGSAGRVFELTEHDTFLLGRMEDCHLHLPGDHQVSRHHFLLEACPPKASLRDLGSLNGTEVNGKKSGGREKTETPEEGAKRHYPAVELKDGDLIQVGQTLLEVRLVTAPAQREVASVLPEGDLSNLAPQDLFKLIFGSPDGRDKPAITVPGYRIEKELGRGGFGAVYRAKAEAGGPPVAVKVMLSRAKVSESAVDGFKREMQVVAGLKHPHIVRFLANGSHQGAFYFIMEYCDGGSLADMATALGGTIPWPTLRPWALQALEGLAAAHEKGFVHRDIKPANILLHQNVAKVGDFGLSKNFQQAGLSGMSLTGQYAGTPLFMPREQITNFKYVKPASDVWSMAASLYFLLTGQFPYPFDNKRDPIDLILNEHPIPIRNRMPGLDKSLAATIDKALARNPKDRFADASQFLGALGK